MKREVTLTERIALDEASEPRFTSNGFMVVTANVARTGVQNYRGAEFGLKGKDSNRIIRLMRPESEVFDSESLATFAHKPVTLGHPVDMVTASNWREHAIGQTGDTIQRKTLESGDFVRIPFVIQDQGAIDLIKDGGVRELSMGYTMDVDFDSTGEDYDAVASNFRINHLAVVPRARGGRQLRIDGDHPRANGRKRSRKMSDAESTLPVQVGDQTFQIASDEAVKAKGFFDALKRSADEEKARADASDAKVKELEATLEATKKNLADAEMTPEKLDRLVADSVEAAKAAKHFLGEDFDTRGKGSAELRKAVVDKQLGNVAADYSAEQIEVAFRTLCVDVDFDKQSRGKDRIADSLARPSSTGGGANPNQSGIKSIDEAHDDYNAMLRNGGKWPESPSQSQRAN